VKCPTRVLSNKVKGGIFNLIFMESKTGLIGGGTHKSFSGNASYPTLAFKFDSAKPEKWR
jgi:hypothetical protein